MNQSTAKVYFIPGLGFDERVISRVTAQGIAIETISWITPLTDESVRSYARRMSEAIDTDHSHITLIGHSFGGIMALEISQIIDVDQIILISTSKSRGEITLFMKSLAPLKMYKLITRDRILMTFPLWAKAYGYLSEEDKALFTNMIADNTDEYLHWAIRAISSWHRTYEITAPVIHIHGDKDKTFPIHKINDVTHIIPEGNHFMIYNRAEEIAAIIKVYLPIGVAFNPTIT